eukprot:2900760-Amphidinium_carterae.1
MPQGHDLHRKIVGWTGGYPLCDVCLTALPCAGDPELVSTCTHANESRESAPLLVSFDSTEAASRAAKEAMHIIQDRTPRQKYALNTSKPIVEILLRM